MSRETRFHMVTQQHEELSDHWLITVDWRDYKGEVVGHGHFYTTDRPVCPEAMRIQTQQVVIPDLPPELRELYEDAD